MTRPDEYQLLLDGAWTRGEGDDVAVVDKYSLEPFASVTTASAGQVAAMVDSADRARRRGIPAAQERAAVLDRAGALVAARRRDFIATMQQEAGFTWADAENEVADCIRAFQDAAALTRAKPLGGQTFYEPLERLHRSASSPNAIRGITLALTPCNSPLAVPACNLAQAFIAGSPIILTPSPRTPLSVCALAAVMLEAGLPKGFLSVLHGPATLVQPFLGDSRLTVLDFSSAHEGAPNSLAFMVLGRGADLDSALPKVIDSGYRRAGQAWTSAQILLVEAARLDEVQARLSRLVHALKFGDPKNPETTVGPLISEKEAIRVEISIEEAVAKGAVRLAGGPRRGAVVPPTLLKNVDTFMKLGCAEIFGPLVCLQPFQSIQDAIERVVSAPEGLVTALFAGTLDDASPVSDRLTVGDIYIGSAAEPLRTASGKSPLDRLARDRSYPVVH